MNKLETKKKTSADVFFHINGGEQEIRTLDAFRHTRFPGVLLRPLGQLTKTCITLCVICARILVTSKKDCN